jgi:HlyD family secretion protein
MKLISQLFGHVKSHPFRAAITAVVLVALLVFSMGGNDEVEEAAYHTVKRSDFLVSIVEGGNLDAVNEVIVRNNLEGTARIIHIVKEGTYIKEGELIAELDAGEAEDALNEQQIAYEKSLAEFVAAENGLIIVESTADSNLKTAELNVLFADMDVRKFEKLEKVQQVRDAEIAILTTQEALEIAKEKLRWSKVLTEKGFESKANLDRDALAVTNQSLTLEQAETTQEMLKAFDLEKLEETYRAALSEARRELERVGKQGESEIAQAQADLNSARATLALNKSKLAKMTEQFKLTKIYAPQDGLIVYAMESSRYSNESMVEEGAQVRQRQALVKIPDTSQMKVEVKVSETHIGQIRDGQPAFVVLDSMPDKSFRGRVTKVALLPDSGNRWGGGGIKEYTTEVLIDDELPDVKPGVSAQVEIVITNLQDVLTVPIQAVTTMSGKQFCYVKKLGGAEPVPVEVGLFNTKFIEIKSGLNEGDQVNLAPPLEPDSDFSGTIEHGEDELDELPTERPQPQGQGSRMGQGQRPGGGQRPPGASGEGGRRPDASGGGNREGRSRPPGGGDGSVRSEGGGGRERPRGGEARPRGGEGGSRGEAGGNREGRAGGSGGGSRGGESGGRSGGEGGSRREVPQQN